MPAMVGSNPGAPLVSQEIDWLTIDRRFLGEQRFPGLKAMAMAMVEATAERRGNATTTRRFFLSSLPIDSRTRDRAVRA